jgi:hypothetical protein
LDCIRSKTEKSLKIGQFTLIFGTFWPHFMNFYHVLKKVGRGSCGNLFSIWYFVNLHALGDPKSVTIFWFMGFGSTRPSAWCGLRKRGQLHKMTWKEAQKKHLIEPANQMELQFIHSSKNVFWKRNVCSLFKCLDMSRYV